MSILHGSWILEETKGSLFIWGETWRTIESVKSAISEEILIHPFMLSQKEFSLFLQSHHLSIEQFLEVSLDERWQSQAVTLPSQKIPRKKSYLPILSNNLESENIKTSKIFLETWQIAGIYLTPLETVKFLRSLPLSSWQSEVAFVGSQLRFWLQIYRWSLDLLARGKFFPGLFTNVAGDFQSCWQPLLR